MKNHIFQIYERPCNKHDWISEWVFETLPYGNIPIEDLKYVKNRTHVIRQFGTLLQNHKIGTFHNDHFILAENAADLHFAGRFPTFQAAVQKLAEVTETEYTHDDTKVRNLLSDLTDSFEHYRDILILFRDQAPIPFDTFIRTAQTDKPYYFAAVLDYHC